MRKSTLYFCLFAAFAVSYGRWDPPKRSLTTLYNVLLTNNSASVIFIEGIQDDLHMVELDSSDCSFTLEFDSPSVGAPRERKCDDSVGRCFYWYEGSKEKATLRLETFEFNVRSISEAKRLSIFVSGPSHKITFSHEGVKLFGGPIDDVYPSNNDTKIDVPFITFEGGRKDVSKANAVVERVWYTSRGRGIKVSEDTPLFIWQDRHQLVLGARHAHPYPESSSLVTSKLELYLGGNIKETWSVFNAGKLKQFPPPVTVNKPMISTWVAYKRDIDQTKLMNFVQDINNHNIDIGIIGIDDGWETCYGSEIVDVKKFPDFKALVDKMHENGHVVTVWVHPFVNVDCEAHERLNEYLVKYNNGTPVTTTWWNGVGGMINFLDENARNFFRSRLRKLQEDYGIDGFKFDSGEIQYIPGLNVDFTIEDPNEWTKQYVNLAAEFGPLGEIRVGAGTSEATIRQRLQDLNSTWGVELHGLRAIIPAMLQLTIAGYGATIPDMIGGNAYNEEVGEELYIRWTQLNTFLPVMQFSIPPWSFKNPEILTMTKKYIALHQQYSAYMLDLWYNRDMTPVVAPLWWVDPDVDQALDCNDQFLVGDQILVAPVVVEGAVTRDIFFPSGVWLDTETGHTYEGPKLVKNFDAPLSRLPWFVRQQFQ